MYDHILIGVDNSRDSYKAAETGIELARLIQAQITFVYVITEDFIKKMYGGEDKISESSSQLDDYLLYQSRTKEIGETVIEKLSEMAHQKLGKEDFSFKTLNGHPIEE